MAKSPTLKIKKFLAPTPSGPAGDPVKTLTFSINRLGYAVADIGQLLVDDLARQQDSLLNAEAERAKQLEEDRKKEEAYNKNIKKEDVESGVKSETRSESKKWGWLEALLKPLKWLAKSALGWFVGLTFLEQPGKRYDLQIGLAVIGGWFKALYKVTNMSVGLIFDGLAEDSPLMGALKVIGGIAGFFVAGRILRPWKLIGDFKKLKKMVDFLRFGKQGSGKRFAEGRRIIKQRRLKQALRAKRMLRLKRLAKVKGGRFLQKGSKFLKGFGKGAGRFLKGGGMSALAGIFSFANRLSSGKSLQNAIGGGAGAAIGGIAMGALLTPVLGPFGPIVGQLIGSFLGDKIGAFLGDAFTPMFKPIKRSFGMYFKIFKALFEPVSEAFADLWKDGLAPLFAKMKEIFKPLVDAGIEKIVNVINSPWFQEALYDLKKLVRLGKQQMNRIANLFNVGSDEEKIGRRVENTEISIDLKNEKLERLEKIAEQKGEDYKAWNWRYTIGEQIERKKEEIAKEEQKLLEQKIEQEAQKNEEVTALLPPAFPLPNGFLDYSRGTIKDKLGLKGGRAIVPDNPESPNPIPVFAVKAGKVRQWGYQKGKSSSDHRRGGMIIEGDAGNEDIGYRNVIPTINYHTRVKPGDKIGELMDARKYKKGGQGGKKLTSRSTYLLLQAFTNHKVERGYNKNRLDIGELYPDIFPAKQENEIVKNNVDPETINTGDNLTNSDDLVNEKTYTTEGGAVVIQPVVTPTVTVGDETNVQFEENEATVY